MALSVRWNIASLRSINLWVSFLLTVIGDESYDRGIISKSAVAFFSDSFSCYIFVTSIVTDIIDIFPK